MLIAPTTHPRQEAKYPRLLEDKPMEVPRTMETSSAIAHQLVSGLHPEGKAISVSAMLAMKMGMLTQILGLVRDAEVLIIPVWFSL